MELMTKNNVGKKWILEEIMKKNLTEKILHDVDTEELLKACPVDFLSRVLSTLRGFGTKPANYQVLYQNLINTFADSGLLTINQAKVYLFLESHRKGSTAPQISKSLKLGRTEVYHILTILQNIGIVKATFEHPIQFEAVSLEKAVRILKKHTKD